MSAPAINLVTALPAEAKPIASKFGLERLQADRRFALYRRDRIALVVSGPGKIDAASATAYLGALGGCKNDAIWINVGVAGHAQRKVGEILLAHKITDAGSGHSWHPALAGGVDEPCQSDSLVTLDRPDLSYECDGMFDMEASGFYPTACRFSAMESVQVLKIISDNRDDTAFGLSAKRVRRLMVAALDTLEALLEQLAKSAESLGGYSSVAPRSSAINALSTAPHKSQPLVIK
jgi:hypothetical protein